MGIGAAAFSARLVQQLLQGDLNVAGLLGEHEPSHSQNNARDIIGVRRLHSLLTFGPAISTSQKGIRTVQRRRIDFACGDDHGNPSFPYNLL
jgi:hypothetical protein